MNRHFCELTSAEQVFITLSDLVADKAEADIVLAR